MFPLLELWDPPLGLTMACDAVRGVLTERANAIVRAWTRQTNSEHTCWPWTLYIVYVRAFDALCISKGV